MMEEENVAICINIYGRYSDPRTWDLDNDYLILCGYFNVSWDTKKYSGVNNPKAGEKQLEIMYAF